MTPQKRKYGRCGECKAIRRAFLAPTGKFHCMSCGGYLTDVRAYKNGKVPDEKSSEENGESGAR